MLLSRRMFLAVLQGSRKPPLEDPSVIASPLAQHHPAAHLESSPSSDRDMDSLSFLFSLPPPEVSTKVRITIEWARVRKGSAGEHPVSSIVKLPIFQSSQGHFQNFHENRSRSHRRPQLEQGASAKAKPDRSVAASAHQPPACFPHLPARRPGSARRPSSHGPRRSARAARRPESD